jgi:hypothetical protein
MNIDTNESERAARRKPKKRLAYKHLPEMFQIQPLCFKKQGGLMEPPILPIGMERVMPADFIEYIECLEKNIKEHHTGTL